MVAQSKRVFFAAGMKAIKGFLLWFSSSSSFN